MSLEAFIWASKLPLNIVPPTAYRVLVLLANHAHSDGRNVWRNNRDMAQQLDCSLRTIERAIRDLKVAGLIHPGDQKLTQHLRQDRRPVVYDLNLSYGREYGEQPELVNDPTSVVGSNGPTGLSRPDRIRTNGPTSAVAHRTVIEPVRSPTQSNYRASVGACGHALIDDRHCERGCRTHLTLGESA